MTSALLLPVLLTLSPAAAGADFDQLLAPAGWELEGTAQHDLLGEVSLSLKTIGGNKCLLGAATVQPSATSMLAVVKDIKGALGWSTAGLSASRVLAERGEVVEYYQHLDVPDWTMAHDRYWVLQGRTVRAADGSVAFQWDRFDWRTAWPDLAQDLDVNHPKAVEPDPNFGAWSFRDGPEGTLLRYYLCTESGNLPYWLQKAAATKTLPAAMADVVREASRREG